MRLCLKLIAPQAKCSIKIMTINSQKRSTMKILALASGALAAPGLVAAACNHGVKGGLTASAADTAGTALRGTGLVVSFVDSPATGSARQVIITNTSNEVVKLSHVYPGVVSTPEGLYNLNSLLVDGSRAFAPNKATTLMIESVKAADVAYQSPKPQSENTWISVKTSHSRIKGGDHVTTVRHMFS